MAQDQDIPPILTERYKTEYTPRAVAPSPTAAESSSFRDSSVSFADRLARNQLPANPLTDRFQNGNVTPAPAVEATTVTPRSLSSSTPLSLQERARQNLQRALDGISGLLGRPVTNPVPPTQSTAPQPAATPNILTTVPRLAPIATPATPIGTPIASPTPFSLDDWMAKQNSKGT